MHDANAPLDARSLSKLRWRCRRGLLENDLFVERFFERFGESLTVGQGQALGAQDLRMRLLADSPRFLDIGGQFRRRRRRCQLARQPAGVP